LPDNACKFILFTGIIGNVRIKETMMSDLSSEYEISRKTKIRIAQLPEDKILLENLADTLRTQIYPTSGRTYLIIDAIWYLEGRIKILNSRSPQD